LASSPAAAVGGRRRLAIAAHGGNNYPDGLGFRDPISQAEKGADFPALIPALLDLRGARIREAERVFVISNRVNHRIGCFHQDVFPFWL